MKIKKRKKILKEFLIYINSNKPLFLITLFIVISLTAISIFQANLLRNIIDNALVQNIEMLNNYIFIILWVLLINGVLYYLRTYFYGVFSARVLADIKQRIILFIQKLSMEFIEQNQSGDFLSRLTHDVSTIEQFISSHFINILVSFLTIIGGSVFMLFVNWKLYLVVIFILPFSIIIMHLLTLKLPGYSKKASTSFGKANSLLKDALDGDRTLRLYNLKDHFTSEYEQMLDEELKYRHKGLSIRAFFPVLFITMRFLPFIFCSIFGSYLLYQKEITFGILVAFLQLLGYIIWPMSSIPTFIGNLKNAMGAMARLEELLDIKRNDYIEETADSSYKIEMSKEPLEIEFKNVSFIYPGKKTNILWNLNFKIEKGKKIAIVGPSGGGKTTILKLLCGFYKVSNGSILLNQENINNFTLKSLRSNISVFFQDIFLFPCSIKENIEMGHLGSSLPEIQEAAKLVNIHDTIENKDQKYETVLSEHGSNLSVGEKQRVALARTILGKASLILLDEPTSALDTTADQMIQESLDKILDGKTAIIVAHRLSTIKLADEIMVIDKGRLIEKGRHQELIKSDGLYKELYQNQFKECEL